MRVFIYLQLKKTSLYINRDECIGFAYRSASPWRYFIQKRLIEIQCDKVVLTAIVVSVILFTYYYFCNGEVFVKMIFLIQEHWEVSVRARSSYRQESDPNRWRTRGFAHSQVLPHLICCLRLELSLLWVWGWLCPRHESVSGYTTITSTGMGHWGSFIILFSN